MQLAPGTVLAGRFEIDGPPLGAGASGVVYPATDRATGRLVAAKVLHTHLVGDAAALRRLQDEAGTAGRLRHPHVLEVLGVHSDGGGRWVLVTERVDGTALSALEAPLQPAAVVALGLQLIEALTAAHAVGIVHGDVRPGNVLLGSRGALLFDFGVATWAAGTEDADDPIGRAAVRPGETAPEVLVGGPPGVPADLYGLGIVLHHALTSRSPFHGETPWAVMGNQRRGPPEPAGPRGLAELVQALLQPEPGRRPASAAVVRAALRRLQRDPDRRVSLQRWWVPPVRAGRAWLVHGVDPGTGGPALMRTGLSRKAAFRLVGRLRAQGWDVRADQEALGGTDILWVLLASAFGAVVLPVVGLFPALVLAMRWRGRHVRSELRRALPPVSVTIPPRVVQSGNETAVAAGLLMMLTALALWVWPVAAILPAVCVVLLVLQSVRASAVDPADLARSGRVISTFAALRADLDGRSLDLEDALGLAGEVDALEASWRSGKVDSDDVLLGVDAISARLGDGPVAPFATTATLEALRRARDR